MVDWRDDLADNRLLFVIQNDFGNGIDEHYTANEIWWEKLLQKDNQWKNEGSERVKCASSSRQSIVGSKAVLNF